MNNIFGFRYIPSRQEKWKDAERLRGEEQDGRRKAEWSGKNRRGMESCMLGYVEKRG